MSRTCWTLGAIGALLALAGLWAGLGFLSKYNMVLYFFGLGILFLTLPGKRSHIFAGGLLSGIVALIVFSPVLIFDKYAINVTTGEDPATVATPGDTIRYTLRVENAGGSDIDSWTSLLVDMER